jgi:hypothetical protein
MTRNKIGAPTRFLEPWLHLEEAAKIRQLRSHIASVHGSIMVHFGADWKNHLEEIDHEFHRATGLEQDELSSIESQEFVREAERAGFLIPAEFWESSPGGPFRYIPETRRPELRLLIREKRRQYLKDWTGILAPFISLLMGLLGAAAALVTALHLFSKN